MKPLSPTPLLRAGVFASLAITICTTAFAGDPNPAPPKPEESALAEWWHGKYATGNWFGLRDTLEDHGVKVNGKYYGAFFGIVQSEKGSHGVWDQGIELGPELNLGKLLDVEALNGVTAWAVGRWRDPRQDADPNSDVEGNSMFNPSNWISGVYWRLLSFGMEISSENMLPVEDMIVLRGGWLQPQKEFIDQPLSKLFLNNAVNSSKGVGGNIPFSSSFSTWGGTLKITPLEWYYAKAGIFMAYPNATNSLNYGVNFGGTPGSNGLFIMAETGVTPKLGSAQLPGKYAFGGYFWGQQRDSFNGTPQYGQYGFYFQFDQMLFREPSPEAPVLGKGPSDGKSVTDAKSFKTPVRAEKPKLSKQGLSMFNLITFAPEYNNQFPFYFQTGLVYQGLIPTRDDDQLAFALAYGHYSNQITLASRADGDDYDPTGTAFLEWFYRIQLSGFAFFQPFVQYEIQPNGTSAKQNAVILGFYTGLNF